MLNCTDCIQSENKHTVCNFFRPNGRNCSECGCNITKHVVCNNFQTEYENKNIVYSNDIACSRCGVYYEEHEMIISKNKYPCDKYLSDEYYICGNCGFDHICHLRSVSFNLLPKILQNTIHKHVCLMMKNIYKSNNKIIYKNIYKLITK